MKLRLILLLSALIPAGFLFSQGVLKGKIIDSSINKPLGLATVTVFKASDTTIITYRLSTPEGEFKVPGIPYNLPCRVVISFSGFSVYRKEFTIANGDAALDIGTVYMSPNSQSLDEVLVFAERPPVVMKKRHH